MIESGTGSASGGVRAGSTDAHGVEAALRRRYDELWADVQRQLAKYGSELYGDIVQGAGDLEDFALADVLMDLNLAEITRDVAEMRDVEDAMERLTEGTYGICDECGEPINPDRLRVKPEAILCLECQERSEKHARFPTL